MLLQEHTGSARCLDACSCRAGLIKALIMPSMQPTSINIHNQTFYQASRASHKVVSEPHSSIGGRSAAVAAGQSIQRALLGAAAMPDAAAAGLEAARAGGPRVQGHPVIKRIVPLFL